MENVNKETKFCKHCGESIAKEAVVCPKCGCQVEDIKGDEQPNIIINNSNENTNTNVNTNINSGISRFGRMKNKWVAFALCFFLGFFGAHKFYEGKIGMGILYFLTAGLFGIGWIVDMIILLGKPNPYYIY